MPRRKKEEKSIQYQKSQELLIKPIKKVNQLLKGFKDILPEEQKYWQYISRVVEKVASQYGFLKIETPVLEETSLFVRTVGKETDVVSKQMYSFIDQGGDNVSLRPEGTAPIVRAFIEHGMLNMPQPVKLYYEEPMFRRENPQAGRYRQFHQFGFEVLGGGGPVVDAQLILIAFNICQEIGFKSDALTIQINSIWCETCRGEYKKELIS